MEKMIVFQSVEIGRLLHMSTGKYDTENGEEDSFYIGIFDEDDLCYQYDGLSQEHVDSVFNEL